MIRLRRHFAVSLAVLAAACGGWPTALSACQVERAAQVPITLAQGFPLIPVQHRGRTWLFLLDTGAQDWLVTPAAAATMGLAQDRGRRMRVLGTDSATEADMVVLQGVSLDGILLPARSVPSSTLPGFERLDPAPAGIIGAPVLSKFDLMFDGPGRQLSLFSVTGCTAVPVPLLPPLTHVPLRRAAGGEMILTISLGGTPVAAVLDTGARGTVLSQAAAAAMARGSRGLRVGDDAMLDLQPTIAPLTLDQGQALLGMDYLGRRRVWISYSTNRMIVQLPRGP